MKTLFQCIFLYPLALAISISAFAEEPRPMATLVPLAKKDISNPEIPIVLQFTKIYLEIFETLEKEKKIYHVEVEGSFTPPENDPENWSLVIRQRIYSFREGQQASFRHRIRLSGKVTKLNFLAVGPRGEVIRESAAILFRNFGQMDLVPDLGVKDGRASKVFITAGLGVTALTYTESARGKMSQTALTAKFFVDMPAGTGNWSVGGNFFNTLSTLTKSTSNSIQVFGTNFRAGYLVPWLKTPWIFRIYGGFYYTTTYGGTGDFGYTNLMGPQLFPTLSYKFPNDAILSGYLKYSPISSGFTFYTLESSESAFGLSHFFPPFKSSFLKGSRAGVTADFSWLKLKAVSLGVVNFQTSSLGFAIRF